MGDLYWLPPHSKLHLKASTMSQEALCDLPTPLSPTLLPGTFTCSLDSHQPHQPFSHDLGHVSHSLPLLGLCTCPSARHGSSLHTPHPTELQDSLSSLQVGPFHIKKHLLPFHPSTPCSLSFHPQQLLPATLIACIFVQCLSHPCRMQTLQRPLTEPSKQQALNKCVLIANTRELYQHPPSLSALDSQPSVFSGSIFLLFCRGKPGATD